MIGVGRGVGLAVARTVGRGVTTTAGALDALADGLGVTVGVADPGEADPPGAVGSAEPCAPRTAPVPWGRFAITCPTPKARMLMAAVAPIAVTAKRPAARRSPVIGATAGCHDGCGARPRSIERSESMAATWPMQMGQTQA